MRSITLLHPPRLVFGIDSINQFRDDLSNSSYRNLLIFTVPKLLPAIDDLVRSLKKEGIKATIDSSIQSEPTIKMFYASLENAKLAGCDSVAGIGGGSVLDIAKLVAAQIHNSQSINEIVGIGNLKSRKTYLACLPTTSGTGSEVSPNAILLDEIDLQKKGVISPFLVPDAVYVDPKLSVSVPPSVTAATGMDALTHCIEAYTNKFAQPIIDVYALEGIRLISKNLVRAFNDGNDLEARESLSLGSMFGGFCLGPVNTAGVHALSYPLGGEFHVAHGLANALVLPHVIEFNIAEGPERFSDVAIALGIPPKGSSLENAYAGVQKIRDLCRQCNIPSKLSEIGIPKEAIDRLVESAMNVTRLLRNNIKEIKADDAKRIYLNAF